MMKIDKNKFFKSYKEKFGKLTQRKVDAIDTFVDLTNKNISQLTMNQWAYAYATTYHETGATFEPIKEWGSDNYLKKYDTGKLAKELGNTPEPDGDGIRNAGKGYVQITGGTNYKKQSKNASEYFGEKLDFIKNPELLLLPKYAFFNLWYGMKYGIYTGRKIGDYVNAKIKNYKHARRVINGNDKATEIAGYADSFESILKSSIIN